MAGHVSVDYIRSFLAVAKAGGFTAAADTLGTSKDSLSKDVARLEAQLGVSLFIRTTRRVELTQQGLLLQTTFAPLVDQMDQALADVGRYDLQGLLRVTVPPDYMSAALAPVLSAFARQYPDLTIDVITDNRVLDLVADHIDVAVRLGHLPDSTLRAVKLADFSMIAVAAPEYIASSGPLERPHDFTGHSFVALSAVPRPAHWKFVHESGEEFVTHLDQRIRVTDVHSMVAMVLSGAGICMAPDFVVEDQLRIGRLSRLAPKWNVPPYGIYIVWPDARHESAKVRAFILFLRSALERI